jgi:hypothetical protein
MEKLLDALVLDEARPEMPAPVDVEGQAARPP